MRGVRVDPIYLQPRRALRAVRTESGRTLESGGGCTHLRGRLWCAHSPVGASPCRGQALSRVDHLVSGNGLPPLFTVHDFEGSLQDYIDQLYWHYRAIVEPRIVLWGRPVVAPTGTEADGRDSVFWHIITQGDRPGSRSSRKLHLMRAAALPWVREVLERAAKQDPHIKWWREPSRRTVHLAPPDYSCDVVLRECRHSFVLLTAFPTIRGHDRGYRRIRRRDSWRRGHTRPDSFDHVLWRSSPETMPAALARWEACL